MWISRKKFDKLVEDMKAVVAAADEERNYIRTVAQDCYDVLENLKEGEYDKDTIQGLFALMIVTVGGEVPDKWKL